MTDQDFQKQVPIAHEPDHGEKQVIIRESILQMLQLQEEVNTQITPSWRDQNYPWYRAAWIECAELMDHHGWKWWKHETPDEDQIHLELVDIWHFGLSDCLQHSQDKNLTADALYRSVYLVSLVPTSTPLLKATEAFARDCLQFGRFPTLSFAQLLSSAGMNFQQLATLYLGKNTLNCFRQDHGYKDGQYHKVWDGKEDNEHLSLILRRISASEMPTAQLQQDVYAALKASYPEPV